MASARVLVDESGVGWADIRLAGRFPTICRVLLLKQRYKGNLTIRAHVYAHINGLTSLKTEGALQHSQFPSF